MDYWGGHVCVCVQSMGQTRGVRGHASPPPPGEILFFFDLLLGRTHPTLSRVSFSFLPKGGQNEIVWIIGGARMCLCAKHGAN